MNTHRTRRAVARLLLSSLLTVSAGALLHGRSAAADAPRGAKVPFTTLEAEAATNRTTGSVVRMSSELPTPTTMGPEMEASGRGYVELARTGDYLDFPQAPAADTIVVRHCIPDAPSGGGQTATLSLYVNGKFRQSLTLSSKYNWLYGKPGQNGQSDDPAAGSPHVFWDETRFFLKGEIKPGDTLRLQRDAADMAAFYRIDLVDLETAPRPLPAPKAGTFLSAVDFGANGADTADDTAAILKCIAAAKEQKKTVWLPAGTYYQSGRFDLDGVSVRGAGMWHTNIVGTAEGTDWAGALGFRLDGDGASVSDLFIDSAIHTRRGTPGGKPFTGSFGKTTNWRVENVWMTHTHVGFWMSGANNGTVRNCRVRFTYADGINLNRGSSRNVVENCHLRGTGDDALALLSEIERSPQVSTGNILRSNTVIATWWGHNLAVSGGNGHLVENNLLADNPLFACLTINLPSSFPMYPLKDTTIRNNAIVRGGGNYVGQRRGAIWIFVSSTTADGVTLADNEIVNPIFSGIQIVGGGNQNIVFERNRIDSPGTHGISIEPVAKGSGVFRSNTVTGVKAGSRAFASDGGDDYAVTQSGNSWQ